MTWQPKINVFDERAAKNNLINYFRVKQKEALLWANNGKELPVIADFFLSPRLVTRFPAVTFLQTEHKAVFEDILIVDFLITLETAIIHGNQNTLAERAPKYSMAIVSMLANVPETTFNESSIIRVATTIAETETTFDVQGKYKNQFIEVFQIRAGWRIEASARN